MKKLVSFTLVVLMLVLAAMPAFAAVRCHHPGCNGTGGNLCAVRYYNQVDTKIREERGTDPANGKGPNICKHNKTRAAPTIIIPTICNACFLFYRKA